MLKKVRKSTAAAISLRRIVDVSQVTDGMIDECSVWDPAGSLPVNGANIC